MLSLEEAHARLLALVKPASPVFKPLHECIDHYAAETVCAHLTQPFADLSAMDGYGVRAEDTQTGQALQLTETICAGALPQHPLKPGQAVRLFTGSALPEGADAVLIQEDAQVDGSTIQPRAPVRTGQHVRAKGQDFAEGDGLIEAGTCLRPAHLALAAAGGHGSLPVYPAPEICLLATGDELVSAGTKPGSGQIVDAVTPGLTALLTQSGAQVTSLGIAKDKAADLARKAKGFAGADLIVTIGGASVGDKDLVKTALPGLDLDFWKLAIRPGKPLLAGHYAHIPFVGLPGNPVSALVCAHVLLLPIMDRLKGGSGRMQTPVDMLCAVDLPANGLRRHFMRAEFLPGTPRSVRPLPSQDSAIISALAQADGLLIRPERAVAVEKNNIVPVLPLNRA